MTSGSEASPHPLQSPARVSHRCGSSQPCGKKSPSLSLPRDWCRGLAAALKEERRALQFILQSRHTFRSVLRPLEGWQEVCWKSLQWLSPASRAFLETTASGPRGVLQIAT